MWWWTLLACGRVPLGGVLPDAPAPDVPTDCARAREAPALTITSTTSAAALRGVCADGPVVVTGNMTITSPTVDSLEGLACLCEVQGSLTIDDSGALTELSALRGLTRVGADLVIRRPQALQDLSGLDAVTEVGRDLIVEDGEAVFAPLQHLGGLRGLERTGRHLILRDLDLLQAIDGLDALTEVGGDLWLEELPALRDISGLAGVREIAGTVRLADLPPTAGGWGVQRAGGVLLDGADPGLLPALTQVDGDLEIKHAAGPDVGGPPALRDVGGTLTVRYGDATSLAGLDALERVGGDLVLQDLESLQDLEGLGALREVGGDLRVESVPRFLSAEGAEGLERVGGSIVLDDVTSLRLDALSALTAVQGVAISNWGAEGVALLSGLDGLVDPGAGGIAVDFTLQDLVVDGLGELESTSAPLTVDVAYGRLEVNGFTGLREVGTLRLAGDDGVDVPGLMSLQRAQEIVLSGSTTTEGLDSLEEVAGSLTVTEHDGDTLHLGNLRAAGRLSVGGLAMNDLADLGRVEQLGALALSDFDLTHLGGMGALTALGELELVDGRLGSLGGLEALTALDGLAIVNTDVLTLDGMGGVHTVRGPVTLFAVRGLQTLDGLDGLREIDGDLSIEAAPDLADLSGLLGLEHVAGDVILRDLRSADAGELAALGDALALVTDGAVIIEP